jgi:prevent-host-death family protein
MTLDLTRDFKTVSDLKANLRGVLSQVHATRRPVVITVKGKPDAVLMGIEEYERQRRAMALFDLLAEGERDVRAGRVHPAREVLADLASLNEADEGGE